MRRGQRRRGRAVTSAATTLTVNLAVRLSTTTQTVITSSFFDSAVDEFDAGTGALVQTLVAPNSQSVLSGPSGMTVGPDGNLYLSSQLSNSIVEYNFSTQQLSTLIDPSVLNAIAGQNGLAATFDPAGLRFGPDGDLYVSLNGGQSSTSGGAVIRFSITSNSSDQLAYAGDVRQPIDSNFVKPAELAFGVNSGDQNSLYVSDAGADTVVKIANAIGASPSNSTFVSAGSGSLNYPSGLTWGLDGKLYVTDLGATAPFLGQVLRFNADGSFDEVFTQPAGSLQFQFPSDALFLAERRPLDGQPGIRPIRSRSAARAPPVRSRNSTRTGPSAKVLTGSGVPRRSDDGGDQHLAVAVGRWTRSGIFDSCSTVVLAQDTVNVRLQPNHHGRQRHRRNHARREQRRERHSWLDRADQRRWRTGHQRHADGARHATLHRHRHRLPRRRNGDQLLHHRQPRGRPCPATPPAGPRRRRLRPNGYPQRRHRRDRSRSATSSTPSRPDDPATGTRQRWTSWHADRGGDRDVHRHGDRQPRRRHDDDRYSITVNPGVTLSPNALPGDALNTSPMIRSSPPAAAPRASPLTVSDIQHALAGLDHPWQRRRPVLPSAGRPRWPAPRPSRSPPRMPLRRHDGPAAVLRDREPGQFPDAEPSGADARRGQQQLWTNYHQHQRRLRRVYLYAG